LVRIEYAGINREPFGQDTICRDIKRALRSGKNILEKHEMHTGKKEYL
jgi:hypothetical protein